MPDFNDLYNVEPEINVETDLFQRLAEPLQEVNDQPTVANVEVETTNIFEENTAHEASGKRNKKLDSLGAKGIVKLTDIGIANLANKIALDNNVLKYRADTEDIADLVDVVKEVMPEVEDFKLPIWVQITIYILLAFGPVIWLAFEERPKNRELKQVKAEKKRLKAKNKKLKTDLKEAKIRAEIAQTAQTAQRNLKIKPTENKSIQEAEIINNEK